MPRYKAHCLGRKASNKSFLSDEIFLKIFDMHQIDEILKMLQCPFDSPNNYFLPTGQVGGQGPKLGNIIEGGGGSAFLRIGNYSLERFLPKSTACITVAVSYQSV